MSQAALEEKEREVVAQQNKIQELHKKVDPVRAGWIEVRKTQKEQDLREAELETLLSQALEVQEGVKVR